MSAQQGTPAWYFEGGEDIVNKRFDTEAAQGVLGEARGLIFRGHKPDAVKKQIAAKGVRGNAGAVVGRAARMEWDAVVQAASTDVDAGETNTQAVNTAKLLALEVAKTDSYSQSFAAALSSYGASEKLAAFLANDPQVRSTGIRAGSVELVLGVIAIGAGIWMIQMYSSEGENLPWNVWAIFAAGLAAIGRGVQVMIRK